jgi:transcription elongation GreA/GreB family factor
MLSLKHQLLKLCHEYLDSSVAILQQAITNAQAAANEETKSSAGDKYETTRAMMQLEIEKNAAQLATVDKLRQVANRINPDKNSPHAELGSLVITNLGNFFISISAGKITSNGQDYFAISTASPLGSKLLGLSAGQTAQLDKREYLIKEVL